MKKGTSFVVEILDKQNHTWQGRVYWVQENRTMTFRSALELMQLMSSAVAPDDAAGFSEERETAALG